jgi:hypothetical protein
VGLSFFVPVLVGLALWPKTLLDRGSCHGFRLAELLSGDLRIGAQVATRGWGSHRTGRPEARDEREGRCRDRGLRRLTAAIRRY